MRRILLSCATLAVLVLPAAASAGARAHAGAGLLVVRNAAGDGGVRGHPVATVALVEGFVLGRVSSRAEGRVDIYQLPTAVGGGAPEVVGPDVRTKTVHWHHLSGKEYRASGFRFRAIDGAYRVVVWGSGIYLFAGGRGTVRLQGSAHYPGSDGIYAIDGAAPRSLPEQALTRRIGRG